MALRLVAEFDLWEDVFPWLRVQRAASAGAETPGGGAGAGGAHLAGGRGGEEERGACGGWRGEESELFIPRGLPGWTEVVDTHQTAGRAGVGVGQTVAAANL